MNRNLCFVPAICLASLLSACLFGKDEESFSYTTELTDLTRLVRAYNSDGSIRSTLGVGVEVAASGERYSPGDVNGIFDGDNGLLILWPAMAWEDGVDTGGSFIPINSLMDLIPVDSSASGSPRVVGITRDSMLVLGVDAGVLLPIFYVRGARPGSPCTFSRAQAYQVAANGDTLPLKVSGTNLDRADSVRFSVLLDEEALAASTRFDSREPVTATVRVSCPDL